MSWGSSSYSTSQTTASAYPLAFMPVLLPSSGSDQLWVLFFCTLNSTFRSLRSIYKFCLENTIVSQTIPFCLLQYPTAYWFISLNCLNSPSPPVDALSLSLPFRSHLFMSWVPFRRARGQSIFSQNSSLHLSVFCTSHITPTTFIKVTLYYSKV